MSGLLILNQRRFDMNFMWSKTWPSQSRQLRSDLLSHSNLIRHSFVMCPPGQTYHLAVIVTHQEAHLRNVLFQNLSLDFTRVFHETSCERSQSRTQKTSATVTQPSTIQCCLKQCLRLETDTSSLLLTLSSFQSLKHQQTRPQADHPPRQDRRDLQLHQGGH